MKVLWLITVIMLANTAQALAFSRSPWAVAIAAASLGFCAANALNETRRERNLRRVQR